MSLVHNERTKLTAGLMNTVAAAIFITGLVAPGVALSYDLPSPAKGWTAIGASVLWTIFGLGIHLLARHVLGRLKI